MLSPKQLQSIDWNKGDGLVPAIVQDAHTRAVLMQGYMNQAALEATLADKAVTFYSRSKQRLWRKGESSGHVLQLVDLFLDCDQDSLLILAKPLGPTCHNGTTTCWGETDLIYPLTALSFIEQLDELIAQRQRDLPEGSYTTKLFRGELRRIAQKVGEEGVETALAAVAQDDQALLNESADLVYHLLVLLRARGLSLQQLSDTLANRHR
jgi:phosphoribosyl-AMP cyclohydrolase / phosphoribosyl-ATP pyrophosphohydrolase